MAGVIVAFSKPENGRKIKNILLSHGFEVTAVCMTAAQVLTAAEDIGRGMVVCGYRFPDMIYEELRELLPGCLDMLVIAPPSQMSAKLARNVVFLPMPFKVNELIDTVEMMARAQQRRRRRLRNRPKVRSQADQELLCQAKELLMERNHMTEEEAHHYLQRCSMENGSNLIETAQMVISLGQM